MLPYPSITWCAVQIDGEVNILRGEREQAKDIIDDLSKKLGVVNATIDGYQEERQVGGCTGCGCGTGVHAMLDCSSN